MVSNKLMLNIPIPNNIIKNRTNNSGDDIIITNNNLINPIKLEIIPGSTDKS